MGSEFEPEGRERTQKIRRGISWLLRDALSGARPKPAADQLLQPLHPACVDDQCALAAWRDIRLRKRLQLQPFRPNGQHIDHAGGVAARQCLSPRRLVFLDSALVKRPSMQSPPPAPQSASPSTVFESPTKQPVTPSGASPLSKPTPSPNASPFARPPAGLCLI